MVAFLGTVDLGELGRRKIPYHTPVENDRKKNKKFGMGIVQKASSFGMWFVLGVRGGWHGNC